MGAQGKNVNVQVVQKELRPDPLPDDDGRRRQGAGAIVGAHDWTGELSANGPSCPSAVRGDEEAVPAYALNAFSYGTAIKKLYAAPVALENIALFTNTKLAKVPTSFARPRAPGAQGEEEDEAQVGLAVQQGATGDAYHMYPFFSGLGGYIFGTNRAGNLPVGHRRREREVPEERGSYRPLEQGGFRPLTGERRHRA